MAVGVYGLFHEINRKRKCTLAWQNLTQKYSTAFVECQWHRPGLGVSCKVSIFEAYTSFKSTHPFALLSNGIHFIIFFNSGSQVVTVLQHRGSLWFIGSKLCSRPGRVAHHDRFVGWHGALCSQGTRPGAVNAINGARLACQELGTRGGPQP